MQSLLRSCLRWIALYLVIAAICAALVYWRFPMLGAAMAIGAGAAILVWFGVAYMIGGVFGKGEEARLIRKSLEGGRPQDGEKVAVPGTLSSGFDTMESPISKRRAAIYEYKVLPEGRQQAGVYDGFAMVPATIDGPRGSIRILAAPELDFEWDRMREPEHRRNLDEYIERTQWLEHTGVDIKRELAHLKTVLLDDDGRIRSDIRRDMAPSDDLSRMEIREKVVSPGEKVVAIGHFSSARGGLVPHGDAILYSVKLLKGDADEVLARMKRGGIGHVLLGCGCLTPVILAAIAALAIVPLEAIEQMRAQKDPSWAEVRMERWLDRNVRDRFEALRPSGAVTIELNSGEARGRLDDVRLTHAEAERTGPVIELSLITEDRSQGATIRFRGDKVESASIINGPAIPPHEIEVEQLSEDDVFLVGRVTWLSTAHNLRASFRARKTR